MVAKDRLLQWWAVLSLAVYVVVQREGRGNCYHRIATAAHHSAQSVVSLTLTSVHYYLVLMDSSAAQYQCQMPERSRPFHYKVVVHHLVATACRAVFKACSERPKVGRYIATRSTK